MMNPSGDEFKEDEPLAASMQSREEQTSAEAEGRLRRTAQKVSAAAGDTWAQTREKAGIARQRTEFFLRENPVPTILGALAIGLAIGLAIRYASSAEEKEIESKPSLGNVHWGFLSSAPKCRRPPSKLCARCAANGLPLRMKFALHAPASTHSTVRLH